MKANEIAFVGGQIPTKADQVPNANHYDNWRLACNPPRENFGEIPPLTGRLNCSLGPWAYTSVTVLVHNSCRNVLQRCSTKAIPMTIRQLRVFVPTAICIAFVASAALADPAEKKGEQDFLRLRRNDAKEPVALETAIASYTGTNQEKPVLVDLIGAVHIGDKAYYESLNKAFESYDAVLYELVAPRDATPTPGARPASPVSFLQLTMKNMLSLQFQLDCIDYSKKNFVHADMTPDEFTKSMSDRGESMLQMFLRMFGQSIAMQSRDPARSGDAQLLSALFAKPEERSLSLKRVMASQFEDMETATAILDGPEGSTIVTERNKAALAVLKEQLEAGHARIAIFYGAAHLPDMEERLAEDFQLKRSGTKWLTAWDLSGGVPPLNNAPEKEQPVAK